MARAIDQFRPGQWVRVTQQIPQRNEVWTTRVTGIVERYEQCPTGSWYAHAKNNRLWLDRLVLRKEDGEVVVCNLDNYTCVEILQPLPDALPQISRKAAEPSVGGDPESGEEPAGTEHSS